MKWKQLTATLVVRVQTNSSRCRCCGAPVFNFDGVCGLEHCQMWALGDQAMVPSLPVESPAEPRQLVFEIQENAIGCPGGLAACS